MCYKYEYLNLALHTVGVFLYNISLPIYKVKYLNVTVILLLICRGTYRAYIIMRMSSLEFQYRYYINEF